MKPILLGTLLLFFFHYSYSQSNDKESFRMILEDNWKMMSALKEPATGSAISKVNFKIANWHTVSVPTTIIGGLLANNKYDFDPFFGNNLEKLSDTIFDHTWWFRRQFSLPATEAGKNVVLKLQGINYKANVWLNGSLVADSNEIVGPFRIINLDVTKHINYKGANVLAVEVLRPFNPQKAGGDLAIDYADWIHYPPDYNGGIINKVELKTYDKVGVEYPLVTTNFEDSTLALAHLNVYAVVMNFSDKDEDVMVKGKINDNISFQQKVHLTAGEKKQVAFNSKEYAQLNVKSPRIWWPWEYGKPNLNRIRVSAIHNNKTSNTVSENFGIRQVTSELIDTQSRKFSINGKPIMLRGAAWSPDIFQRRSKQRQEQEIKLVRDMHMNIVRSEGKLEDDNFYDLCDQYGMLVMSGWMCCGAWQYPLLWDASKRNIAMASDSSVMYWLRNKACMLVWLNGSDMPPMDTTVEREYLTIESNLKWPNPTISTADERRSKVSGYSGVKMRGPYEWVPPVYWETDSNKHGGSWSFATEISPGPSIPPYESLVKFISKDSLMYDNSHWLYHTGTGSFGSTHVFDSALNERYGPSSSIKEYVAKAQAQDYEGHRAMMEAYGLNKYHTATGVVQWMLSNPWPGLIWHTYDYYLYPAGTYFGIKKSLEPLHIMYSYKDKEVDIVNSLLQRFANLHAKATVYNLDGTIKYTNAVETGVEKDGIKKCFALPEMDGLSDTYFLRLQLTDAAGKMQSINWYWLSKKEDELNWRQSKWYYTPQSGFADFSTLQQMPKTGLRLNYTSTKRADSTVSDITVTNRGKAVAFFVHIRALNKNGGEDILPVIFQDNYLLLAPGESRTIYCKYANKDAKNVSAPYFITSAWNLDAKNSSTAKGGGFAEDVFTK